MITEKMGFHSWMMLCRYNSMMETIEKFLIADASYSLAFLIFFFLLFCRKIMKMDKLGSNQSTTIPISVWIKFSLLIIVMIFYCLHMLFAYTASKYWLSQYPNFSLLGLFYLVMFTMQLYIVVKEVKKCEIRFRGNVVFWLVCLLTEIMEIIGVEMLLPKPNPTAALQVLMCLGYISLILITLLIERRVGQLHNDIVTKLREQSGTKAMENSLHLTGRMKPTNRLYVEFNKEFQIIQRQDELICEIKIAVYVDDIATIITKTDQDFHLLSQQMIKTFPDCPEMALPIHNTHFSNLIKYGQQRQRCYQNYLIELVKTQEYCTPYFLQFLQIPPLIRNKLIKNNRMSGISDVGKISGLSQEEQELKVPFFKISTQKNNILISNPQILELNICKSDAEILQFHNTLIQQKRLNIQLLTDPPEPEALLHFIDLVVNKKSLWRSFAGWLGLGIQIQNKIYKYFDVWYLGFKGISMQVIGHQIIFDKEGKMHTMYLLSISKKSSSGDNISCRFIKSQGTVLKKRYSDFFNLDKQVRRFMDKNSINSDNLPNLPPKFSPFGRKTSPTSRQARFDSYIKQLISIQGINRCIKFLQFIGVDSMQRSHIFQSSPNQENELMQHSQRSYFCDLEEK